MEWVLKVSDIVVFTALLVIRAIDIRMKATERESMPPPKLVSASREEVRALCREFERLSREVKELQHLQERLKRGLLDLEKRQSTHYSNLRRAMDEEATAVDTLFHGCRSEDK